MRHEVESERFYLARAYSEAVEAAGGIPLHIPLIPRREFIEALLNEVDGVLLPGSASDVDPLRYGQEPRTRLGAVHPLRDETDAIVLDLIEAQAMPLLAICYGMQALNVSRGGTLIQDISTQVPGALSHEQGIPRERRSHTISLHEGGLPAILSGGETLLVNSHHHQAVETLGSNLRATAESRDGLVEAVEDVRADRWVIGVQWHPEIDWDGDPFSCALFEAFINSALHFSDRRNMGEGRQELLATPRVR